MFGNISWRYVSHTIQLYVQTFVGLLIGALSVVLFLVPSDIAPGGVTGVAVILHEIIPDLPIGGMIFVMNIPILYIGYRMLPGGLQTFLRTLLVIVAYTIMIEWLTPLIPPEGFSDDRLLNAIFGGITGGISGGIIFRTGASFGGTSTIALILQRKTGTPMSTTFLYTDALVIIAAGFVFGIEGALYALIVLVLGGIATDYVLEGPSVIRTAVIITSKPEEMAKAIMTQMDRGVTAIPAKGMYTGEDRWMLYVTISRAQVTDLRSLAVMIDTHVFIVIGQGHAAYGEGFKFIKQPLKPMMSMAKHPIDDLQTLRQDVDVLQAQEQYRQDENPEPQA